MAKACFSNKGTASLADLIIFLFIQFVFALAILHLAHVDDSVGSLNDDVYLRCRLSYFTSPRIAERGYCVYSQCMFNLLYMSQTDTLIGELISGVLMWCAQYCCSTSALSIKVR